MSSAGNLIEIDGRPALRFERHYPHPVERVWRAVTDPNELRAWFPSNVEGDRTVGSRLRFVDDDQRQAAIEAGEPTRAEGPMFEGEVLVVDPPRTFAFTWGEEELRYELSPDGDGTKLVFTQLLSHPSVAARNGAGWHACLGGLDELLGQAPPATDEGWEAMYEDYLLRIGPALATVAADGSLTWERATHVDPDAVRAGLAGPGAWGAADHADEHLTWAIEPGATGTVYRLTHTGIDGDPKLAATWHALLLQLDMHLAAGQLVPANPALWIDAYEEHLTAR